MLDQATRLREMAASLRGEAAGRGTRRMKAIAVTSGKGGVGKTNLSVNLAQALVSLGKRVILFDADLGLANADILLGTVAPYNLGHLVRGERDIRGVLHQTETGIYLIAGGSGLDELAYLSASELQLFVRALGELDGEADYLILDTGAGVGASVKEFVLAADQILVVTTPEPTSMADAYTMIKALAQQSIKSNINLVVNQAQHMEEGRLVAERIIVTSRDFLGVEVEHLGTIPQDRAVAKAVRSRLPFVLADPESPAALAVTRIAHRLADIQGGEITPKSTPGFFNRLIRLFGRSGSNAV